MSQSQSRFADNGETALRRARVTLNVAFGLLETRRVPQSVYLAARIAYAEVLLEEQPPTKPATLRSWQAALGELRRELSDCRLREKTDPRARETREAWDEAQTGFEKAYAEYRRLLTAANGVEPDVQTFETPKLEGL